VQFIEGQENLKEPPESGAKPRCRLWVCITADAVRMRVAGTRSAEAGGLLPADLGGDGLGPPVVLVCDRLSSCQALARLLPDRIVLQHCWSHVRRSFWEARGGWEGLREWADGWVVRIDLLFERNRERKAAWDLERPLEDQPESYREAQLQLEKAAADLFGTAGEEHKQYTSDREAERNSQRPNGTRLARLNRQVNLTAILVNSEEGLSRFLDDPRIPPDNNASERVLRRPVISRHTSFGSGGPDGARVVGIMFGVFATVRLAGLNLYAWVNDYLEACARGGGTPPANLDPWLPWRMDDERKRELSRYRLESDAEAGQPPGAEAERGPPSVPLAA